VRRLLFGGSFDPVHSGHLQVGSAAGRALAADRVSLVPAADAPHKRGAAVASAQDRLAMCRLAAATDALFDVLDVEVRRGGVSYTIDTVAELAAGPCRGDHLLLLLGQDSLADLPKWHRARELAALLPIAVVPRPGATAPPWTELEAALGAQSTDAIRRLWLRVPQSKVSSREVRRRVAEGKSIRCWVPDPVADYIEERGLYR
jgi:nicotinate-nucleotide adenylyltransferase